MNNESRVTCCVSTPVELTGEPPVYVAGMHTYTVEKDQIEKMMIYHNVDGMVRGTINGTLVQLDPPDQELLRSKRTTWTEVTHANE